MNTHVNSQPASHEMTDGAKVVLRYSRRARWKPAEYIFWALPVLAYFLFPRHYPLLTEIVIVGLFVLSLDIIYGYAGIISLGHGAFFGVGAYVVGLIAVQSGADPLYTLLLAGIISGLVGLLVSFILLRGNDLSRLMVTLGVGFVLFEIANKMSSITGGEDGLPGMMVQPIFGVFHFDIAGHVGYVYSLIVTFILFLIARRLVHSSFGQSLRGIKSNRKRMAALGVQVDYRLVVCFTISAMYAGFAGALLAQTTQFVSLSVLGVQWSINVLIMLIIGGTGTLYGAFIGAMIYVLARQYFSHLDPQFWSFWLGLLLIVIVLAGKGGFMGIVHDWLDRYRARKARNNG